MKLAVDLRPPPRSVQLAGRTEELEEVLGEAALWVDPSAIDRLLANHRWLTAERLSAAVKILALLLNGEQGFWPGVTVTEVLKRRGVEDVDDEL